MPPKSKRTIPAQATAAPSLQSDPSKRPSQGDTLSKASESNVPPTSSVHQKTSQAPTTADKTVISMTDNASAPAINRKKQKRREKEAAKKAAEQNLTNGYAGPTATLNGQISHTGQGGMPPKGYFTEQPDSVEGDFVDDGADLDEEFYSGDEDQSYLPDTTTSHAWPEENMGKKKRNKKSQKTSQQTSTSLARTAANTSRTQLSQTPTLSSAAIRSAHRASSDSIWNTSTQAERENIKQFWLELGEDERRSLVKVEKEAVLRKMKEQQKHSCSCSVCGRKRTAIEEELEVLYDAYYEELEQFANHNHDLSNAPQMMAPPRSYKQLRPPPMAGSYPSRGRVHELNEDDDDLDDDEDYEDEDEPYSDEDLDDMPPGPPDFFTFGNSLTVKDGILTVADDLLKNDGKHFIDMMEQLAERRMQREEEIHYPSTALAHQGIHQGHNHPPLDDDEDDYDDEDDEDYDSQEEEDFEGDEMDSMTEEQRMEEGRRMFQIFAARMFEQRVLTAYREKVAKERQQKLLEELDEESRLDTQREAKKAKEAAKKKEKKRQQKLARDEEKARKESEKAAQEAAAKEAEERKLEEQRQRREEQRRRREAERKAAEEERVRKEAERQRRAQEERERQAETERKQREAKEREKKKREEAKKKEREEREAKEKEARERKAKEEQDTKAKEEQARREKETAAKVEKEAKDRQKQDQAPRRHPVALPSGLHPSIHPSQLQSPHFQVATPIMPPKVPTPSARSRQTSQPSQASHGSSPRSQNATTNASRNSVSPPVTVPQTPRSQNVPVMAQGQPPVLHHPQPSAPLSPLSSQGRTNQHAFNANGIPGFPMGSQQASGPPPMSSMGPPMHLYSGPQPANQSRFGPPQGIQYPPGFGGPRQFPPNQLMPAHKQVSMPPGPGAPIQPAKQSSHSRQASETIAEPLAQPAPIARPGPIGRPSSTTPDRQKSRNRSQDTEVEQLATQLGSKALLDDSDVPLSADSDIKVNLPVLGAPGTGRAPLGSAFGEGKHDNFGIQPQNWSGFSPSMSSNSSWGAPSPATRAGVGWPQPNAGAFGAIGGGLPNLSRAHASRPVMIRTLLAQACRQLSAPGSDGFIPMQNVLRMVDSLKAPNEPPVSMEETLTICDTEGNAQNGGGFFEVRTDAVRGQVVKFEPDIRNVERTSVGDIGSPISTHGQAAAFGGVGQGFGPPGRSF